MYQTIYTLLYKETWKEELMPRKFVIESFFFSDPQSFKYFWWQHRSCFLDVKLGDIGYTIGGLKVRIYSA